jgi:serine/threonine protein kinase/ABC-type phosphate/phosphonate transport system substrate-binding protein
MGHCPACLLTIGAEEASDQPFDSEFGDYKLVRQIGRGAMGVVYEAIQLKLKRPVALKLMLDSNIPGQIARRRFWIEAEAAAQLSHPNIVRIYDFGEWQGQPFLSMHLVQGQSLKEKLPEFSGGSGRGDFEKITKFMILIADAVAHAHERGVLHRDLKPGNILIDSAGEPHLTDFGLAKIMRTAAIGEDPSSIPGAVCGTPSYMAPEQVDGGTTSIGSDVYSLGAVFYELLTGQPPFRAPTAIETMRLVTQQDPRKPRSIKSAIPKDLETICLKCLEKNPGARYTSTKDFAADLKRWIQGHPIAARSASVPLRTARWLKRNPIGAAFILTLSMALAASLFLLKELEQRRRLEQRQTQMLKERQILEARDKARLPLLQRLTKQRYYEMWSDPTIHSLLFTSMELAMHGNYEDGLADNSNAIHLTLGMENSKDPLRSATNIAPFLKQVEKRMEKELQKPVLLSLRLQKHRPDVGALSIEGKFDFQRLGPLAYINAKGAEPSLKVLVEDKTSKDGVIFANTQSGITSLAGIAGHRVAFAHSNSIVSFVAKVVLAQAGIAATNLQCFAHLDPPRVLLPDDSGPGADSNLDLEEDNFAHMVVIESVISNLFHVGEARVHHFKKNKHRGLVKLDQFDVPPRVYMANTNVAPEVAEAFANALCSLDSEDIKLAAKFFGDSFKGFQRIVDTDLDPIRAALTNEVRIFEQRPE